MKTSGDYETKEAILKATETLLNDRTIKDLHVQDICDAAFISRPTFYGCFKNKYEIFEWHLQLASEVGCFLVGRIFTWNQGHTITTQEIKNHPLLYERAAYYQDFDGLMRHGRIELRHSMINTVQKYKKQELTSALLFQINAYSSAHVDAIDRWVQTGMRMSVDELVRNLESVVPRELYELLNVPEVTRFSEMESSNVSPDVRHFLQERLDEKNRIR